MFRATPNCDRVVVPARRVKWEGFFERGLRYLQVILRDRITSYNVCYTKLLRGTTGSGKSVALNAMVLSLLYKASPEQVRLIMIDPKMLELSVYEGIVITSYSIHYTKLYDSPMVA